MLILVWNYEEEEEEEEEEGQVRRWYMLAGWVRSYGSQDVEDVRCASEPPGQVLNIL